METAQQHTLDMGTFRMTESIAHLATALATAQGNMRAAAKDSKNPHFRSTYADLASAWDACRDILAENGISVVQIPSSKDGQTVTVSTVLAHKSGEWMAGDLTLPLERKNAQGAGSAITYARRYSLMAMVGIAPDDDDGNAACLPPTQKSNNKTQYNKPAAQTQDASLFNKNDLAHVKAIEEYFVKMKLHNQYWQRIKDQLHGKHRKEATALVQTYISDTPIASKT